MKILHNVTSFGKQSYGLGAISLGLAKAQLDLGHDVYVWSSDSEETIQWASEFYDIPVERMIGFPPNMSFINASSKELICALNNKSFEIVHQHSLWTSQSIVTSLLRKNGTKICIAPHGTLSQFSLNKSKFKKKIALSFFEHDNLSKANVLHATSEYEIEDFRRMGLKNPIAYITNGVSVESTETKGDREKFITKYKLPREKKVLLYLSRITPKKGLDMLLPAIAELGDDFKDWILVIVGNDEFAYQKEIEQMVRSLNLLAKVFIIEPQFGNKKFDVFDAADFFILPSYSEGSPMVVVDALAYGLPVITTKSSSWQDLKDFQSGYWVDIDKAAIKSAINNMLNLSDDELKQYSENAKDLVRQKYLWEVISKQTLNMYQWLLLGDEKPNFIY